MQKPPLKVTLHLRRGETIYRIMATPFATARTPLHPGRTGEVSWRVISKKRIDGRIEAIHFVRGTDGADMSPIHVVVMESKFEDFLTKIRQAIDQFAPGTPMRIGTLSDFDEVEYGPYFVMDPDGDQKIREKFRKQGFPPPPFLEKP